MSRTIFVYFMQFKNHSILPIYFMFNNLTLPSVRIGVDAMLLDESEFSLDSTRPKGMYRISVEIFDTINIYIVSEIEIKYH